MSKSREPRAIQNGMSPAEYATWMFLSDKDSGIEPYSYIVRQEDLTRFLQKQNTLSSINELERIDIDEDGKVLWTYDESGDMAQTLIERIAELKELNKS